MRLLPTGECWCGCGEEVGLGKFFLPGHDKKAEAEVIRKEYGGAPQFVVQHGYGSRSSRESSISEMATRYAPEEIHPRNTLNDLTAKQWIPETISVWNQQGRGRTTLTPRLSAFTPLRFRLRTYPGLSDFSQNGAESSSTRLLELAQRLKPALWKAEKVWVSS